MRSNGTIAPAACKVIQIAKNCELIYIFYGRLIIAPWALFKCADKIPQGSRIDF